MDRGLQDGPPRRLRPGRLSRKEKEKYTRQLESYAEVMRKVHGKTSPYAWPSTIHS